MKVSLLKPYCLQNVPNLELDNIEDILFAYNDPVCIEMFQLGPQFIHTPQFSNLKFKNTFI